MVFDHGVVMVGQVVYTSGDESVWSVSFGHRVTTHTAGIPHEVLNVVFNVDASNIGRGRKSVISRFSKSEVGRS